MCVQCDQDSCDEKGGSNSRGMHLYAIYMGSGISACLYLMIKLNAK